MLTIQQPRERGTHRKTFVIDTNVLLYDPQALENFPNQNMAIPATVLEELDSMKRLPNELGRNSRVIIRYLDSIKRTGKENLHSGLTLPNGSKLRIQLEIKTDYNSSFAPSVNDNKIIMAAFYLKEKGEDVVFVSKDIAARIKAEAIGLAVQDYENLKFAYDTLYSGIRKIEVAKHDIDTFYKDGFVQIEGISDWKPNEYCVMRSAENSSAVAKFDHKRGCLEPLLKLNHVWGVKPRNVEQKCAIDLLMRDDIKLVTLMGQAGTGKTLLALAAGLRKVFDEGVYNRILVSRPIVPLGRDIGYLPGTKEEKLTPWMQPIRDNLEFLCSESGSEGKETMRWVMDSDKIEMEAVTYIRGRTLPKMFIIIDEAQNLTPHEVKTVISRAGEGTKVVLAGDATQIDNPYLDKESNGVTYTVGKFFDQPIYGHAFLEHTERSELAKLAAEIM